MARSELTGSRIRALRTDRGMRQADLARDCDISPSYLNLIEHNRRRIGGALLNRIAASLEADVADLSEGAEAALVAALDAAAQADAAAETARTEEFAGRFPGWARLVAAQEARIRRLERVVEALNDRLTHDPFLSASLHDVLSSITAIRSASAILAEGGEVAPEWQARFHRNIYEDSRRLADTAEALVAHFDAGGGAERPAALPQEEVEAWLGARGWRVAELESDPAADPGCIIAAAAELASEAARALAGRFLARYAEDAAAVPEGALCDAVAGGAGPARLAGRFGVALPVIYRRLAALPATGFPDATPRGLVACDASGTLVFRKPVEGFDLPRHGAACALWPLFEALRSPMLPVRRRLRMGGRDAGRFETEAIADIRHPAGFDGPAVAEAWMLVRPVRGAAATGEAAPVGTSCRICVESACPARREPSILVARGAPAAL